MDTSIETGFTYRILLEPSIPFRQHMQLPPRQCILLSLSPHCVRQGCRLCLRYLFIGPLGLPLKINAPWRTPGPPFQHTRWNCLHHKLPSWGRGARRCQPPDLGAHKSRQTWKAGDRLSWLKRRAELCRCAGVGIVITLCSPAVSGPRPSARGKAAH